MTALARHFRVKDLANLWSFSEATIIRLFRDEPGVLRLEGERRYTTISIPESVALRVHTRLAQVSHNTLKSASPGRNPLRVIALRDTNGRVSKQSRNVVQRNATQQKPNSKRVA